MIKSNVRSYELVKAINDEKITFVDAAGTSTLAGIRTGVSTSAVYNDLFASAKTDGKSTQAFIRKEDVLVAATKYTTTKIWVYLDQEGAIKFYQEFVSTAHDFVELALEKYFDENIEIQEFEFLDFIKVLDEEILVVDLFESLSSKLVLDTVDQSDDSVIDFEKNNQEIVVQLEHTSIDFERPVADLADPVDDTSISFETGFFESASQTDSYSVGFEKTAADEQTQADTFSRDVEYNRTYADAVYSVDAIAGFAFTDEESDSLAIDPIGANDDPAFNLAKAPIFESQSVEDTNQVSFSKPVQETVVPSEIYSQLVEKSLDELVGLSDYDYIDFEKVTDENVNQYDEIEVLVEWIRQFEEYVESNDIYSALFEMGQIDDYQDTDDIFDRTVEYNRDFSDTQTISDLVSSVSFNDEESDSVITDPFGLDDDPAFNLDKAPIDLSISNEDLAIISTEKLTAEAQNQTDSIDNFAIDKAIANDQEQIEEVYIGFSTSRTDQYSVDDDYTHTVDFNRDFRESVEYSEDLVRALDKALFDSQTNVDQHYIDFTKPDLEDQYSVDDDFNRTVEYQRTADDSVLIADNLSGIAFFDEETDSVAFDPFHVDDDPAFDLAKPASDTFSVSDQYASESILSKTESQNQTDFISSINTDKSLVETQTQSDSNSIDFAKGQIQETVTEVDYFERTTSYTRLYSETQQQIDENSKTFSKGTVQETVTGVDSRIIQSYKYFYETMSETDSGTLLNTDYVGSYYFDNDFVGSKRTF